MDAPETPVVTRIGFAERWLHRARAQYAGGDTTGGLRMLALADAEVRIALHGQGWAAARIPAHFGRCWTPWLLLAAAAAAAVWVVHPAPVPADAGATDGPPIVRFSPAVGSVLSLTTTPATHDARRLVPAASRQQPPTNHPTRRAISVGHSIRIQAGQRSAGTTTVHRRSAAAAPTPASTSAPAPASASSAGSSLVLSEVDIIDMVLAATQALRGTTGP